MKSNKDLIRELIMQNRIYAANGSAASRYKADKYEAELLSRLNRLEEVEKENKELKEKDLYWRKRVTELEENENRFPTLAEFSNLQDDYEQTSKENDELRKQVEDLQKRLDVSCHIKADDKVKFDFAVLDIVDRYERLEEIICASAPLTWARGEYINEVANFEKSLTDILHEQSDTMTREGRNDNHS